MRLAIRSKTAKNAGSFRRGWGRIWGSIKGGIYLVPTETSKIVVQTAPDLKISCILPTKTRRISVSWDKKEFIPTKIKTPTLVFQQILHKTEWHCCDQSCSICRGHPAFCFCGPCKKNRQGRSANPVSIYNLYELRNDPGKFPIKPYRMGNVYETGKVCFGRQNAPHSIRQANFNYWNSSFNNDFPDVHGDSNKSAVKHSRSVCNLNVKHLFLEKHNKNTYQTYGGVFEPHPKSTYLSRCCRAVTHKCQCSSSYHRDNVLCPCYTNTCNCSCECLCCKKMCDCKCQCLHCVKQCACCECNLNEIFARTLQTYKEKSNSLCGQRHIFGTTFLASSKPTEGVFITYSEELLRELPDSALSTLNRRKAAIGLATITKSDTWRVDFKADHSITFSNREVYLV